MAESIKSPWKWVIVFGSTTVCWALLVLLDEYTRECLAIDVAHPRTEELARISHKYDVFALFLAAEPWVEVADGDLEAKRGGTTAS